MNMAKSSSANKPPQAVDSIHNFLQEKGITLQFPEISASFPIQEISTSSCRVACPAGVNIKAYVGAIARGDFERALEIVKMTNPLPGICGRVCTHPCESECRRGEFDDPVAICALKRFIADYELKHRTKKTEPCPRTKDERVAIIGSGPAGLTAASDLIRMGYGVTIFEELPVPGGMLITGIPPYRLPRDVIETEIADILELGVEIKTSTKIDDLDGLFDKGYKAAFLAIGAHKGLKLRVPGEDEYKGVIDCVQFLRKVNSGEREKPGEKIIVIGGGNSAIDSARSALRLGCKEVHIVYRRSRQEMPASEDEINEAEAEGIKIDYLAAPVKILGKDGQVIGMECTKMKLGEPDQSGRRRPIPIPGSEFVIDADLIVSAISQKPDISCFKDCGIGISKWDSFEVDQKTMMTSRAGVFAGGDAVTGPNTVIDAIAAGHRAARSIDHFLKGEPMIEEESIEVVQHELTTEGFVPDRTERTHAAKLPVDKRQGSFAEVELTLSAADAIHEAKRCLRCGPCTECIHCIKECSKRVIGIATDKGRELLMVHGLPGDVQITEEIRATLHVAGKGKTEVIIEPVVSNVDEELCRGCGDCENVCDYGAIQVQEKEDGIRVAQVDVAVCKGCGTCTSVCPTGAAHLKFFRSKDIESELEDFLNE
jgi:NADPH-dependent glutamate synthase beta subunit-like oxidoreductase/ferredoxin